MDFRPFAKAYVANTYEDFAKKAEIVGFSGRARLRDTEPLFTYSPSEQDVREQMQRFQDLQLLVLKQRAQIRRTDEALNRGDEVRRDRISRKSEEKKKQRRTLIGQLRAFSVGKTGKEAEAGKNKGDKLGKTLPRVKGTHRDRSSEARVSSFYLTEAYH